MKITEESVLEALKKVGDPITGVNIVDRKMVGKVVVDGKSVTVFVTVNQGASEDIKFEMIANVTEAVKSLSRWVKVEVHLEQNMNLSKKEGSPLDHINNIIAVASGKGGVGKSTVTSNLAGGLKKAGFKVGIIDADIYGPSIPTMFDVVGEKPTMTDVNGTPKINPVENYGIKLLSIGFFTEQDNAVVWRGPMAAKAMTQMFTDSHWGELDYLLIDLPPGTGDIHLSLVQTVPLDGAVIVSTPQEVALADARKGVNMFQMEGMKVPVVGVIENMAWFTPAELPDNRYYIFGRDGAKNLASGMNVPFLGHIPLIQSVREAGDVGRPAVFQDNSLTSKAFDELVEVFIEEVAAIKAKKKTNGYK